MFKRHYKRWVLYTYIPIYLPVAQSSGIDGIASLHVVPERCICIIFIGVFGVVSKYNCVYYCDTPILPVEHKGCDDIETHIFPVQHPVVLWYER
jgi:hypothetical protein